MMSKVGYFFLTVMGSIGLIGMFVGFGAVYLGVLDLPVVHVAYHGQDNIDEANLGDIVAVEVEGEFVDDPQAWWKNRPFFCHKVWASPDWTPEQDRQHTAIAR